LLDIIIPHLILIQVTVQKLFVVAVDDGRSVTGSKHMSLPTAAEGRQQDGLGPEQDLLLVCTACHPSPERMAHHSGIRQQQQQQQL